MNLIFLTHHSVKQCKEQIRYGTIKQTRSFTEFLLLVANYKKALLSKARRKTIHRHLKGVCSWNALGNRWLSKEKLEDSGLTGKLFE